MRDGMLQDCAFTDSVNGRSTKMTCTECNTTLVKTFVELEGESFLRCWTCDCSDVEMIDAEEVDV